MGKELRHFGTLGMKWGIRRYQPYPKGHKGGREVGEAARKRRSLGTQITRNSGSRRSNALAEARSKDINKMTTQEIKQHNDRLNAERQYAELTKGKIASGKKWVTNTTVTIGTAIVTGIAIETGKAWVKKKYNL